MHICLIPVILRAFQGPTPQSSLFTQLGAVLRISISNVFLGDAADRHQSKATQWEPLSYILTMPLSNLTGLTVYHSIIKYLSIFNFPACLQNAFLQMAYFNRISKFIHYIWLLCLLTFLYIFARPINLPSPTKPVSFVYCFINESKLLRNQILMVLITKQKQ